VKVAVEPVFSTRLQHGTSYIGGNV
jgi:hypothetical protein